jgi:DNA repair protein RecO (recombination protein O)
MSIKHELHLAYVLHARSYRETSLLVEMFSQEFGRIALVARGAKRGKSKLSAILQPFIPLTISWYGNGDLVTLTQAEPASLGHALQGKRAICGLYINELLVRLLHKWDPCLHLFANYQELMQNLTQSQTSEQVTLRKFEKQLLKSLGYGLQLTIEVDSGTAVEADKFYLFDPILGPKLVNSACIGALRGTSLLALEQESFESPLALADIKYLMRLVFNHHLGARPLAARQLL